MEIRWFGLVRISVRPLRLGSIERGPESAARSTARAKARARGRPGDGCGRGHYRRRSSQRRRDVAKRTAKGVGDAVTLHPIDAVGAVGKGAVTGGKDVTVGAAKGTGKVIRGVGSAFKTLC